MYNINDFYNEYKYIELKDTIKNNFIASILLGIDNRNFRKNINDFKDIIEYYKTKLNKFVNDKYNKNFTKNNKDHLNILEKLIKYNLVVYNVNKNKILYENDSKIFNKYIILLNKDNKTHLLFKYKDQKKITKLSKNDLINIDIMNGGENMSIDTIQQQKKNIDINGSKKLLKKNININLNLILNNDNENEGKINDILTNLSNIIKDLINNNGIIYNPLKEYNYNNNIDYKDIIELYILNGHDAKKDFENKNGVFVKSEGQKHDDYFNNYKFLELYIIFYNLTKNNDSFNINLVTCRLAYYISINNYFIALQSYIPHIINKLRDKNNINNYIKHDNNNNVFPMKTDKEEGDISFFIVIALNDFEFNEYSSFNVLNNLHSNLLIENNNPPSIANTNEKITIFKLYDAQNNAKTQLNILEDNPFIKNHNIKQLVLLSNFIDSGNIGADALDRLQDYKKYIHKNNINDYKKEVHKQFLNLCKIFTFNKKNNKNNIVNIEITQKNNVTKIELNNNNVNDNNILDILDPINILEINKNIINNNSLKKDEYKISLNIDKLKIFEIIINYEDIKKYFNNDLQYLKFSKVNHNTINNITKLINKVNNNKKSEKIKKLLNLKALGDFSHCIFLNIFKSHYEKVKRTNNNQEGGTSQSPIEDLLNNLDINILEKLNNLFYFAEGGPNRKFRFNSTDENLYNIYEKDFFPIKIILPGSSSSSKRKKNLQKIIFLNINGTNIGNNLKVKIGKYFFRIHRTHKQSINNYFNIKNNNKRRRQIGGQSGGEDNNVYYQVEKILDHSPNDDIAIVKNKPNEYSFLVNWKGYNDPVDDTWQEYDTLINAKGSIDEYINKIDNEKLFIHVSEESKLNSFENNKNEDSVNSIDVINLIYNFFYILCDDLKSKNNLNKKDMEENIVKYIDFLNDKIKVSININFNEIFSPYRNPQNKDYIGKYININHLNILKEDQLNNFKRNYYNRYFNYILNILFKIYLYDELLFMIIARKINNIINTDTNNNNKEYLLNETLEKVYFNIHYNQENYLNKINTYFSIPSIIEDKLNLLETDKHHVETYNSRIRELKERFKYDEENNNKQNKMYMISTIDNLLKTYCLANDLSFSIDGGIITYN